MEVEGLSSGGDEDWSIKSVDALKQMSDELSKETSHNSAWLFVLNLYSTVAVCVRYLLSWESVVSCGLGVGLTAWLYYETEDKSEWDGGGLSWTLLSFAVIMPMTSSIRMAFARREAALKTIAALRSTAYQMYVAHTAWDWTKPSPGTKPTGRKASTDVDWLKHSDEVLTLLLNIAHELSLLLTLPCTTRARNRLTPTGKLEHAHQATLSRHIMRSILTRHLNTLTTKCELLKHQGLPPNEATRIRQWERSLHEQIETLRTLKAYRTPQALRSFARLFSIILPAFYSPFYAQISKDVDSLPFGLLFAFLTSVALTALFESIRVLEDPFVAHTTLDGIDVHEELNVLFKLQLIDARHFFFPDAHKDRPFEHYTTSTTQKGKS